MFYNFVIYYNFSPYWIRPLNAIDFVFCTDIVKPYSVIVWFNLYASFQFLVFSVMLFICCNQFILYSCILSKTGVIFSSSAILPGVYPAVFDIRFISAAVFFLRLLLECSKSHYCITELEGPVYCIILFLFSFKISVV